MTAERGFEGQEVPNGFRKFSPEARTAIERARLPIFTLTEISIRDMRQSGMLIADEWPNQDRLETLPSRKSEVAIEWVCLKNSLNKPMSQQQKLIKAYSTQLSE